MINNKPTYISLFSSAGVGCYGFKLEGFECVATNELIEKRINIQKINNKCKYDSGYICGNIKDIDIQKRIFDEIKLWGKEGNDRIDVIIATPPCQGMSVANHKKNKLDIDRNSLIVESIELIKKINPRFFIFENVSSFWKTGCIDKLGNINSIGDVVMKELGEQFTIYHEVLNFKNYGANSSRTRTLVIGIDKKYFEEITPIELMPDYTEEKFLIDVIGDMNRLKWGEYDINDFFHSFRKYPEYMINWIKDLKQGKSAFDNDIDELKPHRIIDGKLVVNKSKNADKYRRQIYSKVAPCIHTRNDQLASQNTIHPIDNRVFSIRELMYMMTIPKSFKWLSYDLDYLNQLSKEDKQKISKKEELNIRRSIGEAVPTIIFEQIAKKIRNFLSLDRITSREIINIIKEKELENIENLKKFIMDNKEKYSKSTLSMVIEYANSKRQKNSAYFTNKSILHEIFNYLPEFDEKEISIIEPSVGSGNFLPFIFKKYEKKKQVSLTVIDIDSNVIELLKILYSDNIPENFKINFVCADYMYYYHEPVNLIIGNPPFSKVKGKYRDKLLKNNYNKKSTNLAEFILEKAIYNADYVSIIMPKNILNTPEFEMTRKLINQFSVESIIDFGEKGFKGVLIETVNIIIHRFKVNNHTKIVSVPLKKVLNQKSNYIFDLNLPYWVIYRNEFFDKVYRKMNFNIFDVFRDRQITNSNTKMHKNNEYNIRVVKARNILDDGTIKNIDNYDSFIDRKTLATLSVNKFFDNTDVYLTPNMTYKPRLIKKEENYVVNGSVAILILKDKNIIISNKHLQYISSEEYRKFYKIARNYQTRSLNIDSTSSYWFGLNKELVD